MLFSPPRDILAPGQIIVSATQAEESTPEMRTSCSALVTGTSEGRCNGAHRHISVTCAVTRNLQPRRSLMCARMTR